MAAPLLFAALAEAWRWELGSWRRTFELTASACLGGLLWARIGLVPTLVILLFVLCGVRLALPRELSQRRQILLMAFLIWITTAITTFEADFLLWSILWVTGSAAVLLQQAWDGSASLRGGPLQRAPYLRLPGWTVGTVALSAACFLILPRITLGLRAFPWNVAGLVSAQAGFSDSLELGQAGAIAPNGEVVLRVLPANAASEPSFAPSLALLKGLTLEVLDGQHWSAQPGTPGRPFASTETAYVPDHPQIALDYFVAPNPHGILPFPYGGLTVQRSQGVPILNGPGGSLRWMYPPGRPMGLRFLLTPGTPPAEGPPRGRRWALLTAAGKETESAARFSRALVPDEVPAQELAERLSSTLQRFDYTLDNPSGGTDNPLQHFLEVSRAGHCEYFASALALMLRHRGIPARVVNGYRLGPWIPEGGYWLVTQNEAHSWVEYFDAQASLWRVADPTPAAPPRELTAGTLWAAFQRWTDALRFRWDRHVVRFSGEDQLAGLQWLQTKAAGLPRWRPGRSSWVSALALGCACATAWAAWRYLPWHDRRQRSGHGLTALAPLLRVAGQSLQPHPGETARQWLQRLGHLIPERAEALGGVAAETDAVAYGGRDARRLSALAKEEAKVLRRLKRR